MRPFKFCPSCAAGLRPRDREGGAACPSCGRTWYQNSAPTAACTVVRDGRALVTVRAFEPERGKLDVPGGFLAPGEDPIEGLKREIAEELDVEVDVSIDDCLSMSVHQYGDEGDFVLSLGFKARTMKGEPRPGDDVAEVRWVATGELDELDFAWPHDRELVRRALASE